MNQLDFELEVFDYIEGDNVMFEREPFELLVEDRPLISYTHAGFWQCMDIYATKESAKSMGKRECDMGVWV